MLVALRRELCTFHASYITLKNVRGCERGFGWCARCVSGSNVSAVLSAISIFYVHRDSICSTAYLVRGVGIKGRTLACEVVISSAYENNDS